MPKMTPKEKMLRKAYEATQQASVTLVQLHRMLHDAGLRATARAVNEASKKLGWEMADAAKRLKGR